MKKNEDIFYEAIILSSQLKEKGYSFSLFPLSHQKFLQPKTS